MTEETKEERKRRLNRERVARFRLRQRHKKELEEGEGNFLSIATDKEAMLEQHMQELEFIKNECEAKGIPLWASERFREWEDQLDKLIENNRVPKPKSRGKVYSKYVDPDICPRCGYPIQNCICGKQSDSWLKSPTIK